MLTQEQAVEVRVLARRGGKVKQIARELGVSRNTVRRYLRDPDAGRYKPRAARAKKLDPFREYLQSRIEAAQPRWIPATVLLREIRERGYEGGISQLKAYLTPFKGTKLDPVVRFETAPGEQMQADFTTIRRGRSPLKAFVATLGFSRATFVRFTQREDSETLLSCLRQAFGYFGGVTAEVLFDNATTIASMRYLWTRPTSMARGIEGTRRRVRLPAAAVPTVSSAHQGQGRTLQRLLEGQLRYSTRGNAQERWPPARRHDRQRAHWPLAR
jgi:transposase